MIAAILLVLMTVNLVWVSWMAFMGRKNQLVAFAVLEAVLALASPLPVL